MQNADVARFFDEFADLLEIQGENAFKIRAYRNASRTIAGLTESIVDVANDKTRDLQELPGIGKEIAAKIKDIVETGELKQLTKLREEIPAGVLQLLRIPGLGPKKVAVLMKELSIASLADLKAAAEAGKVAELKGFGQKTEAAILKNIDRALESEKRVFLAEAKSAADRIVADLLKLPWVTQACVAGSCRRRLETVGDLDVLATSTDARETMDFLAGHELVKEVLARGDTKQRVRLTDGLEMDLRVVPDESYGAALQYFTGSKEHNVHIRQLAQKLGLKLNEYGLFKEDVSVASRTEEEVYAAVGLPWIPPELRENRGEIELAEAGKLPGLIERADLLGDLHMHTTATDGRNSIREMAEGAKAFGLKYIAITDHSQRVAIARGLNAERLRAHWKEIEKVQSQVTGIDILRGIECDILEDATMDLPDDVLAEADWVIAVLHFGLNQPREQIMKRLLNAVRNPHVDIIGHPSGRMIPNRGGADIHYDDLFKAAADTGTLLEINAQPKRLDLDDVQARAARDHGIPIVISSDSHSDGGFAVLEYGVYQARRAGLEKKDVANTLPLEQFRRLIR